MTREQMIYQCMQKLPYPISFYDKLNDGSLYSVWHKHIELGIPIDKKAKKYKELNDKARAEEKQRKEQTQSKESEYKQISIFEYIEEQKKKTDSEPITAEEYARRCLNRGEINMMTNHIFGESVCKEIVANHLTVEEYFELTSPQQDVEPILFYNEDNNCYYIKADCGDYMLLTDEEVDDYRSISYRQIGVINNSDLEKGPRLVLKPGK